MRTCVCGKATENPKFCSRRCAAKINNKVPKKKRTSSPYFCETCEVPITYGRKYCPDPSCLPTYVDWENTTMGETREKRKYQVNSRARAIARRAYFRYGKPRCCLLCGYDKHFDVCHVKAISDFPDTASVAETIVPANLVALCKNHHWEFDHGLLSLEDLKTIQTSSR